MDAPALLAASHARLLRILVAQAGCHFQGLSQAGKFFSDTLSGRQRKFLKNLELAHHVCRHVTVPLLDDFQAEGH